MAQNPGRAVTVRLVYKSWSLIREGVTMYRSFRAMILLAPLSAPVSADQAADPFGILIDAARRSAEARETATPAEPTRPIIALPKALLIPRPDPIATRLQRAGEEPARWARDLYPQLRGSAQRGDTT